MLELRLPEYRDGQNLGAWARELVLQLRRQWVPVLRRVQSLSPYGLQANDTAGTVFTIPWFKVDVAQLDVSSTLTATAMVRPGLTFAVFAQNLTVITGSLASYDIGTTTPADGDAWHAAHGLTLDTEEDTSTWIDTAQFTITPPIKYDAATDIVLTPNGGTFSTGTIKLISYTLDFNPYP